MSSTRTPRITVIGAGVIGLSCAVRLAEAGYEVNVLARELPLETTSAVAGALWMPYLAEPYVTVLAWSKRPLAVFPELAADPGSGVLIRKGHLFGPRTASGGPTPPPPWASELADDVRLEDAPDAAAGFHPGWRMRLPLVDMERYLPYLVGRLAAADGTLTRLAVPALPTEGVVLNCTGLAARGLASDPELRPVRGQLLHLRDPGLTEWVVGEDASGRPAYVFPHGPHVVVGGTADDGDWSTVPDPRTAERLRDQAVALVPALREAAVIGHRVGLRPVRSSIRLEVEPGTGPNRLTVHCYGHGGSGVTMSWGCADAVFDLVSGRIGEP